MNILSHIIVLMNCSILKVQETDQIHVSRESSFAGAYPYLSLSALSYLILITHCSFLLCQNMQQGGLLSVLLPQSFMIVGQQL